MADIKPGSFVQLKGSDRYYQVEAIYSTYALIPEHSEIWCRLTPRAYWPIKQLEIIEQ